MSMLLIFGLLSSSVLVAWALAFMILEGLLQLLTGMKTSTASGINTAAPGYAWRLPGATAGQSGDLQGLPDSQEVDSRSVVELLEDIQFFEAELIAAVESAPDADVAELATSEVPEDDVPAEYFDSDSVMELRVPVMLRLSNWDEPVNSLEIHDLTVTRLVGSVRP